MKRALKKIFIASLLCLSVGFAFAWGTWGHHYINHASILVLPDSLQKFFYNHADFITEESVVPDIRKYTIGDKAENPRHFIDVEDYGPYALQTLPKDYQSAFATINKDSMNVKGSLPWTIEEMQDKLTDAFKKKKKNEILFLAATIGHYLGDANMPLHVSYNHSGKQTNQPGIHSLFEGQMLEMFGQTINLNIGKAPYFKDITKTTWDMIATSNASADTLLKTDAALRKSFPKRNIFRLDSADRPVKNQYGDIYFSDNYVKTLHKNLNGLLERRVRAAIYYTSGYWYTAWINAGKPDLSQLDDASITKKNHKFLKQELKLWQKGKIINLKPVPEFKLINPVSPND